jgi:hypothetical protein
VSLTHHPPTANHYITDELRAHRKQKVAGEIIRRQWRSGMVTRQHEVGRSAGFETAEFYSQAL